MERLAMWSEIQECFVTKQPLKYCQLLFGALGADFRSQFSVFCMPPLLRWISSLTLRQVFLFSNNSIVMIAFDFFFQLRTLFLFRFVAL